MTGAPRGSDSGGGACDFTAWSRLVTDAPYIVWGPELSPFLLKLESLLFYAGLPFRRLPREGSRLENLRTFVDAGARVISVGRLTHSAPSLDLSLEVVGIHD